MRNAKREQSSSCHPAAVMPTTLATRSRHRKALSAVMFAALLMTMGCDASKRPNVVLVLIDTLRKDHVGAFGYERDTTPFIDELAEQGTVFLRTVSQAPWTTPSMASIWTSRYPSWLGVGAGALPNGVRLLEASPPTGLSSGVPTLAEKLEENGYATIAVVANRLA